MESKYMLKNIKTAPSAFATQNACKLCSPLGAALVFKGIEAAVPLLHGSQGCSTYIRRYLISHFKEPIDIACSNFGEQTAIFGGGANFKLALDNIMTQYSPKMIGVATTCLAETIGDDVPMFIKEYHAMHPDKKIPPVIHVSTPSYQGTHMQGFHRAVLSTISSLAGDKKCTDKQTSINLFPGMVSPADIRLLKQMIEDFDMNGMVLPDYSDTLDGKLWSEYQRIPEGGTPVEAISQAGSAAASIELGHGLAEMPETAGVYLQDRFGVPVHRLPLPMGICQTDRFLETLADISGNSIPRKYVHERGRLLDALVDGHKYVNKVRAVVYGETDLVAGIVELLSEIGVIPVVCATGDASGHLEEIVKRIVDEKNKGSVNVLESVDFVDMEETVRQSDAQIMIGNSKGYSLSRKLGIPLVRIGFPVHDRVGGSRLLHLGYPGAQSLFDRIANTILEIRQNTSDVGYTYM